MALDYLLRDFGKIKKKNDHFIPLLFFRRSESDLCAGEWQDLVTCFNAKADEHSNISINSILLRTKWCGAVKRKWKYEAGMSKRQGKISKLNHSHVTHRNCLLSTDALTYLHYLCVRLLSVDVHSTNNATRRMCVSADKRACVSLCLCINSQCIALTRKTSSVNLILICISGFRRYITPLTMRTCGRLHRRLLVLSPVPELLWDRNTKNSSILSDNSELRVASVLNLPKYGWLQSFRPYPFSRRWSGIIRACTSTGEPLMRTYTL